MAYNTNTGNNTLYPRIFYTLYIGPNNIGIGHLIFRLSTKEIFKTIGETDSFTNKIQIHQPNSNRFIAQDDHFNNTKDDNETQSIYIDNFEDEGHNELDSSQQIN